MLLYRLLTIFMSDEIVLLCFLLFLFHAEIECVQLTHSGRITFMCQTRVMLNMGTGAQSSNFCYFDAGLIVNVPCKYI